VPLKTVDNYLRLRVHEELYLVMYLKSEILSKLDLTSSFKTSPLELEVFRREDPPCGKIKFSEHQVSPSLKVIEAGRAQCLAVGIVL
jgi:hypothetical protein